MTTDITKIYDAIRAALIAEQEAKSADAVRQIAKEEAKRAEAVAIQAKKIAMELLQDDGSTPGVVIKTPFVRPRRVIENRRQFFYTGAMYVQVAERYSLGEIAEGSRRNGDACYGVWLSQSELMQVREETRANRESLNKAKREALEIRANRRTE
jgi:hypothetical protein